MSKGVTYTGTAERGQPCFGYFIGAWHQWFSWFPIRTYDCRFVWLRKVWRRRVNLNDHLYNPHGPGAEQWWWYQINSPTVGESDV